MTAAAADDLVATIKSAAYTIEVAGVPSDLRAAAFEWVLEQHRSDRAALRTGHSTPSAQSDSLASGTPRLNLISNKLGIPEEDLERIYDTSSSQLSLVFARSKLPSEKARAAKQTALIYTAGDQAAYGRDWTPISAIREVCKTYGVFDSGNFAGSVLGAGDALIARGKGLDREIRLTRPGYETVGALIRELLR